MLVSAAKVASCPEREKCIILLLDEMHIRQDLVFDKHTGEMIGFCNLGYVNEHLSQFEESLSQGDDTSRQDNDGVHGSRSLMQAPIPLCTISVC